MARAVRVRIAVGLGLAAGLLGAPPARALLYDLTVVPSQSYLEIAPGAQIVVGLGTPPGPVAIPLESPAGSGSPDGLRAPLSGMLDVEVPFFATFQNIFFRERRTVIAVGPGGTYAPGPPGDLAGSAPAAFALAFGANALGVSGGVALRDVELSLSGTSSLRELAPGLFRFPEFFPPLPSPQPALDLPIIAGVLDADTSFGLTGRLGLPELELRLPLDPDDEPRIELFPGDLVRLTLPLHLSLVLTGADLFTLLPVRIELELDGRLVAQNFAVPEPGTGALLALGLVAFAFASGRAARRTTGDAHG